MGNLRGLAVWYRLGVVLAALIFGLLVVVSTSSFAAPVFVGTPTFFTPELPTFTPSPTSASAGISTETPAPPPWQVLPVITPADVICPVEPPAWWGMVTPSSFWWFLCGHCVEQWQADWGRWRWPSPTPGYVFPTVVFPTVVLTSTPSPTLPVVTGTPSTLTPSPSVTPTPSPSVTPTPSPWYAGLVTGTRTVELGRCVFCEDGFYVEPYSGDLDVVFGVYEPCGRYHQVLRHWATQHDTRLEGLIISHFSFFFEREPPPFPEGKVPGGVWYYPSISVTHRITVVIDGAVDVSLDGSYPYRETEPFYQERMGAFLSAHNIVDSQTFTVTAVSNSQSQRVHFYHTLGIHFPRLDSRVSYRGGYIEIETWVDTCASECGCSPTPTPTITPSPTITPVVSSPCEDPFLGGTPYEVFEPPSFGDAYCLDFGPVDTGKLPIVGRISIPRVRLCLQEIRLGSVRIFDVSVSLDLLIGIFISVALIRWISSLS